MSLPDVGAAITELAGLVAGAGRVVWDHVPEDPIAPCWIIQGSEDVIQVDPEGTYANDYLVSLDVVILVPLDSEHDNLSATRDLWAALRDLATALATTDGDWWLERVGQPGTLQTLHWKHHGVLATVRTRT